MIDPDRNVANDALLNAILLDSTNGRDVANDMGLKYNMSPERVFLYVTLLLGVVVHQLLMAEDTEPILYSRFTRKKTELPIKGRDTVRSYYNVFAVLLLAYNIKPERGDLPDSSSFITSPAATTIPQTPYAVAHSTTATTAGPLEADVAVTDSGSVRTTTNAHTSVVAPVSATNTFFAASNTSMASWTPTNYTVYLAMKSESPVVCKCSTDDTQSQVEKATTMSQQFGRVMSLALRALDSKAENKELSQQIVNLYKEQTSSLQDLTNQTLSLEKDVASSKHYLHIKHADWFTQSLSVKNVRVHNQLKGRLDAVEAALKTTQSKNSAYDLFQKFTQKNITYLQDLTNFLW
ncbi:hypothetical protein EB796_008389 [Bugula neritina]|uniref:Uncharacterized protein n=1 Tax=Bugula neritina TaxID=10212 RepID=A0A7J7K5X2_BUGNE|nr:hypothetical protein EB796_008389 [Bugula neritina]